MRTYFLICVILSIYLYNIALQNTDFGVPQKSSKHFLISIFFLNGEGGTTRFDRDSLNQFKPV